MTERERLRALLLRGFCAVAFLMAIAIGALGFDRGVELLDGQRVVAVWRVAERPLWVLIMLAAMVGPGVLLWRRPHLGHALIWSMFSVGCAALLLATTMARTPPPAGLRAAALPSLEVFHLLILGLATLLIVLLPIACGAFALAMHERPPERLARARVHRLGRGA